MHNDDESGEEIELSEIISFRVIRPQGTRMEVSLGGRKIIVEIAKELEAIHARAGDKERDGLLFWLTVCEHLAESHELEAHDPASGEWYYRSLTHYHRG